MKSQLADEIRNLSKLIGKVNKIFKKKKSGAAIKNQDVGGEFIIDDDEEEKTEALNFSYEEQ